MALERTFSIIKPDATRRNLTGAINAVIEKGGLRIVAQKRLQLSRAQAEAFYAVHKERPFFASLVEFMTSGPVVVQVLEGENAVARYREVMGATNPANAAEGTIRKLFAESIEANSAHGSDSPENAAIEIAFFFAGIEIVGCPSGAAAQAAPTRRAALADPTIRAARIDRAVAAAARITTSSGWPRSSRKPTKVGAKVAPRSSPE
jgi:nucleoside-diphosphate kinase